LDRRKHSYKISLGDLEEVNLRKVNLKEANLIQVNLKGANLEEANFEGSDHYKVHQLRYFEKDKGSNIFKPRRYL
jgi:hypothetical protein